MKWKLIKAGIIGSSGACGKEMIKALLKSEKVSDIVLITRRILPEWDELDEGSKLKIIQIPNFDELSSIQKELMGCNAFFCCIGANSFAKNRLIDIDYKYAIEWANIAKYCQVPYYSIISSYGAKKGAHPFYLNLKWEIEEKLREMEFKCLTILRPCMITERKDQENRFSDKLYKVLKWVGVPYASVGCIAQVQLLTAAQFIEQEKESYSLPSNIVQIYSNKEIKNIQIKTIGI